jgi:hypothetical protein
MINRTAYIETNNINLASSLLTLGIPFNEETQYIKTKSEKGEQFRFFFQEVSNCGKFKTGEMMNAWYDESFPINNPEHPFAYLICDYKNRNGLLDLVKQPNHEVIIVEKNGKIAVISKNASEELQHQIFSQL